MSHALLGKLVEKGILTSKEAEDLRRESTGVPPKSKTALGGMPDWVTSTKLYGDFRGRFQENAAENDAYRTRDRFRYRVRVGLNVTMIDSFEVGTRVASGNPLFNPGGTLVGGSPISATYKFDRFPMYTGPFPVKLSGEYMNNPAAAEENQAYRLGITFGKAGKKRAWELSYRYQRLEADAWFDALLDDDNGAYYATGNPQLTGTGKLNGWFAGSNVKGHQMIATYSVTDFANINLTYYANDLILKAPGQPSAGSTLLLDLNLKY